MVHVSKRKLDERAERRLARDFIELLAYPKTKAARTKLIQQFFTPKERALFSKRIALILMLANNVSFNTIEAELCVSTSTVSAYLKKFKKKDYESIVIALKHLYKKNDVSDFLSILFATPHGKKLARRKMVDVAKSVGAQYGTY